VKPALKRVTVAACLIGAAVGCAGGRVRGGQGTEMQQEEEYLPEQKVQPPEGNTNRVSGPLTAPTPPPVLEVDLERRRRPPPGDVEPEPGSNPEPGPETER
jgi:hypothetical protein